MTSSGCILWLLLAAQTATRSSEPDPMPDAEAPPVTTTLERLAVEMVSADGNYRFHLWFRGQLRYSYPFDGASTAGFRGNKSFIGSRFAID